MMSNDGLDGSRWLTRTSIQNGFGHDFLCGSRNILSSSSSSSSSSSNSSSSSSISIHMRSIRNCNNIDSNVISFGHVSGIKQGIVVDFLIVFTSCEKKIG